MGLAIFLGLATLGGVIALCFVLVSGEE